MLPLLSPCALQNSAESGAYGPMVRLLQVANVPSYANTTSPQSNDLSLSIPWSRASPNVTNNMSAVCYYLALEMLASVRPASLLCGGKCASPNARQAIRTVCPRLPPPPLAQHPDRPVGIVSSNWPGTSINA